MRLTVLRRTCIVASILMLMLHCYGSHLREAGHGFFSVESGDDAASAILSHPQTHGVPDQASSKRPRPQGSSSSEASRKRHRCRSSGSEIASCTPNGQDAAQQAVKGIVNHRGGTADNATEYKIRFAKPHDDKRLDEWWPQKKVDVQHIRVYVARKARKAGTH
eukprot:COSAG02_NODE_12395_length_1553_cov_4.239340_2_plen_163_part_00